jgi:hypothetical protein
MTHPLFDLARRLDRRTLLRRREKSFRDALSDPHLAEDLGLAHRPKRRSDPTLW